MRGKVLPNCIDSGVTSLSVVLLTPDVPSLGFWGRLRKMRGLWCYWGTDVMQDSFRLYPNNLARSAAGRRMLNPSFTRCRISLWTNTVILGVHVDTLGLFEMSHSRAHCVQAGPVCTSMPLSTYFCGIVAAGCQNTYVRTPRVTSCLEEMKVVIE